MNNQHSETILERIHNQSVTTSDLTMSFVFYFGQVTHQNKLSAWNDYTNTEVDRQILVSIMEHPLWDFQHSMAQAMVRFDPAFFDLHEHKNDMPFVEQGFALCFEQLCPKRQKYLIERYYDILEHIGCLNIPSVSQYILNDATQTQQLNSPVQQLRKI